jgi:hypothetical protein
MRRVNTGTIASPVISPCRGLLQFLLRGRVAPRQLRQAVHGRSVEGVGWIYHLSLRVSLCSRQNAVQLMTPSVVKRRGFRVRVPKNPKTQTLNPWLDTTLVTSRSFVHSQNTVHLMPGGVVHATAQANLMRHPGATTRRAWSVSEYVFGVRTSKLARHLGVKSLSMYSREYVKQTRH